MSEGGTGGAVIAAGVGVGGAIGGVAARHDAGFDDESLKQIGMALKPATSALVVTTSQRFVKVARKYGDELERKTALRNLANDNSAKLDAGKEVFYALANTETGVALSEIAADDETVEVLGVGATEGGVVAGAAVATQEGVAYEVGVVTVDNV